MAAKRSNMLEMYCSVCNDASLFVNVYIENEPPKYMLDGISVPVSLVEIVLFIWLVLLLEVHLFVIP